MEILNNLWVALSTENEVIVSFLYIPLAFIEAYVSMLLFAGILNIKSDRRQKIAYVFFASILGIISTFFIPKPYSNIITLVVMPFAIMFIFKTHFPNGIVAEFLPLLCITILEILLARIFLLIFNADYAVCANIPICRLFINLFIYAVIFFIHKLTTHFNFHIIIKLTFNARNKMVLSINTIFAIIVMFMQIYLIVFYNDKLPSYIILINILSLIAYFAISIYSMIKTMNLEQTTENLEQAKMYNQTLQILYDNLNAFEHDFSNIVTGIGGYVDTDDMEGLKKYYRQFLQDCSQINNLCTLSPDVINSPSVYTVLADKYYKADNLGIKITLDAFINFDKLYMGIYEFTRILGILMDNAIEASSECDNKIINVTIRNDQTNNRQLLIVENTYNNKDVNIDKIYEKGYSSKSNNKGLGLWEVDKIIKKRKNITRFTTKNEEFFTQQIEIYNV